jgi:hypothetical protein
VKRVSRTINDSLPDKSVPGKASQENNSQGATTQTQQTQSNQGTNTQDNNQEIKNKELIDSNGDGISDLDAIKFNIDPSVAIVPVFSISNISSASLDVYSGENKYQINLTPVGQKSVSRSNILLNISKSIRSGIAFDNDYDYDTLSFGKISSDEYIKFKANFLDKYKTIDRASIYFSMELYNGNGPLIDTTILNSMDVILFNNSGKLIQNKKFEWNGKIIKWKRSDSKWGAIEGDINNISLLNKIMTSNFYVSVVPRDIQYTIRSKQFNFEDQKESIKKKSSEIIFSNKSKTVHYYVSPGQTLDQLCKMLNFDCAGNIIYESELSKKIWNMSASEEFNLVSVDIENQKTTLAGKTYYIVKTNQNEVLSVKKEDD